jgi:hypothetical protein
MGYRSGINKLRVQVELRQQAGFFALPQQTKLKVDAN